MNHQDLLIDTIENLADCIHHSIGLEVAGNPEGNCLYMRDCMMFFLTRGLPDEWTASREYALYTLKHMGLLEHGDHETCGNVCITVLGIKIRDQLDALYLLTQQLKEPNETTNDT